MFPNALTFVNHGIQSHLQRFAIATDRISDPDSAAGVEEIIEMKRAEQGIKINAAVIRATNDMSDSLINILV